MIVQCAWCNTVRDSDGAYTIASPVKLLLGTPDLPLVSHGICPACVETFLEGIPS